MKNRSVHEQCVGACLMLSTKVIHRNENQIIVLLDSILLKSVLTEILVIEKCNFLG